MTVGWRLAALIGAWSLLSLCGSARAAEAPWEKRLEQSERLSDEGKTEAAVKVVQGALADADKSLGPDDPAIGLILSRLSRIYETAGDSPQLLEIEGRLSAFKPKGFRVWFALGRLRRREGKFPEAEEALTKALAIEKDNPGAMYELALLDDETGRFEDEIRVLKETIELNPQNFNLHIQLAKTYSRLGRPAQSQEAFARARKLKGETANAYIKEGYFYMRSGEAVHAKESFESAIAVDTASPFGYHHMGTYLLLSRQYPEAEKNLRLAVEKMEADPNMRPFDVGTINRLGAVIEAQGRYPEAEALYLKALKKARGDGDYDEEVALRSLARLYAAEGKNAKAEELYKRAVTASQSRANCDFFCAGIALIDLGEFYLGQGRRAEAEAMAERAEKLSADVPIKQDLFDVLRALSAFYAKLGDDSKREALYARLLPMRRTMPSDPDLVWVESGLAEIEAARGRLAEAEDHYRQAIGVLDQNSRWKEEADLLDALAAIDENDGKAGAGEAREHAKSLRARK